MTPQEQEMIDGLVDRIRSTQVANKDVAAEQRLQQGLAGYPDATYVLAQTVLVQQYGLKQAQAQIEGLAQQNATLENQLQQAAEHAKSSGGGGFLSHIFGSGQLSGPAAPANQAPPYQPVSNPGYNAQPYPGGGYPPPPPAYPPQGYPAQGGGMFGGGGGGFLQGAMQTAAGVAAGEMMFQGMESLFHGFEHGGGGGSGLMGGDGRETVVNNYYDGDERSASGERDRDSDRGDRSDSGFYNPSDDASRSDSDGAQFADTGSDGGQDFGGNDDSSFGDGGADSSGFDDNSGSDDGSGGGF